MMGLIDEAGDGRAPLRRRPFRPDRDRRGAPIGLPEIQGDLRLFRQLLVGLTATPKDEVDRDTYRLFDLETGVPTDAYGLDEAVKDGYLVPPKAVSRTTDFLDAGHSLRRLIRGGEGTVGRDWNGTTTAPSRHRRGAGGQQMAVQRRHRRRVLEHLMAHGLKVEDGDRLGKTIIFAKNRDHAEFIA